MRIDAPGDLLASLYSDVMSDAPGQSAPSTPSTPSTPADPRHAPGRIARSVAVLRRVPVTVLLALAILTIATVTGTILHPAEDEPWFDRVATGLPAFAEGRWWTLATSPVFANPPSMLLLLAPLVLGGVGWAEWRFGSLRTLAIFAAGHAVGVLGAAALLAAIVPSGWGWAERLAQALDVGPSCGAYACLAFALAPLPSPWRLRARFALAVWAAIEVLYIGQLANLEHAIAVAAALAVSGALPAFRHPAGRPSSREWRLLAFAGLVLIGVVQLIDLVVPYQGPLGDNHPTASAIDVAIDVIVIIAIANGVRQGVRLAWWITLALAVFNVASVLIGVALIPVLLEADVIASPAPLLGLILAPGLLWLAELAVLLLGRGAFRVPARRSRRALAVRGIDRAAALARLRDLGGGTLSWMIGWAPNRFLPTGDGVVGFQTHSGVAIALGDPIARPGQVGAALAAFSEASERAGLIPCVFSCSDASVEARPPGWRSVVIAEDTIVRLEGFTLAGKRWQPVRTSVNRAARESIEFRMCVLAEEPWGVRAQVRAISEQWAGDKGLPEMRFTLGTVEEALDPETRVGLAVDAEGTLHGVVSWLPVYGAGGAVRGWTLDLMRRRDGGFGPVMEFLIAASAQHFAAEGAEFVSLSGAPLVRPGRSGAGAVDQVLDRLAELIEPLYGFTSLHRFKQKFHPSPAGLSLLYRDEGDLPRIAVALTRAYLPDASLRELLGSASGHGRR